MAAGIKSEILIRLQSLSDFIRNLEDFAKVNEIEFRDEKIYIAACAQRRALRELIYS